MSRSCRSGETGRRARLKIASPQGRGSSTLPSGMFNRPSWRNWQTRTTQDRVGNTMGVRVSPTAVHFLHKLTVRRFSYPQFSSHRLFFWRRNLGGIFSGGCKKLSPYFVLARAFPYSGCAFLVLKSEGCALNVPNEKNSLFASPCIPSLAFSRLMRVKTRTNDAP